MSQTLAWNALGQLTGVETAGQGWVHYAYDAFGRRVRRVAPTGEITRYVYDGDDLLLELDSGGNVQAQDTYYPGTDQVHSVRRAGITYFYATDRQGNVRALVNSANEVVNRYAYRPFGMHESVSEQVPNPLRYNAREFDPATGLYYYRARWYDPAVHRFLSQDPAAEGTNMYAYVSNDPVNYTDPTGMYQQALRPCPRSEQGLIAAYAGKCEWGQTILLEGITVVAPPRADPRGRTREGRRTTLGEFGRGIGSYPRGVWRFGRHVARRHGVMGRCERQRVATEDAVLLQAAQVLIDDPAARRVAFDAAQNYVSDNKARVGGRVLTGVGVSLLLPGGAGLGIGTMAVYGDLRYSVESGVNDVGAMAQAAIGGADGGSVHSACGS